jgi:lipocalin
MAIIPLDDECFWCIVPLTNSVEIWRNGRAVTFEERNWQKMTNQEKADVCNKLIQEASKEYSDIPDVSKRPICFEV